MAEIGPPISEQLADIREVQENILTTLNLLLEAIQAQSEMLADILAAAAQEPAPSPVAEALAALVATVQGLADNQATLITHIAELPATLGRQLEVSLGERLPAAADT
jgi:hypothetical protein